VAAPRKKSKSIQIDCLFKEKHDNSEKNNIVMDDSIMTHADVWAYIVSSKRHRNK
jgi:hypothetical protein